MVEAVVVRAEGGEEEEDMVVVAAVASAVVTPAPVAFVVMDDIMLLKLPLRRRGWSDALKWEQYFSFGLVPGTFEWQFAIFLVLTCGIPRRRRTPW